MKIRPKYTIFVNGFTSVVFWGGRKINSWIHSNQKNIVGEIYDCNLNELKDNLKYLESNGFLIVRK